MPPFRVPPLYFVVPLNKITMSHEFQNLFIVKQTFCANAKALILKVIFRFFLVPCLFFVAYWIRI